MHPLANDLSSLSRTSRDYLKAQHGLFIDGRFVESVAAKPLPVIDPTSGEQISQVPAGDAVL